MEVLGDAVSLNQRTFEFWQRETNFGHPEDVMEYRVLKLKNFISNWSFGSWFQHQAHSIRLT